LSSRDAKNGYTFPKNPIYELTIYRAGGTAYYLQEKVYSESVNEGKPPFVFLEMENGKGVISERKNDGVFFQRFPEEESGATFKTQEPILRQISDPSRFYPLFTLRRAIENLALYDHFDTTLKSVIRQPSVFGTEEKLLSDGQNLMSILLRLKNHHSLEYDKIEAHIKTVNPNFKDVNFDLLGSKMFLVLREQFLAQSVSIEHISDGTLRFLILLSIFYNPERGNAVFIDEPEIGLHPDMISTAARAIKWASQNTQIIAATHSPLLLNSFELDEVLIFEKNEHNQTTVSYKSEGDFEKRSGDYLTGQLWLQGQIGGKRW
jgi:predicted ATPase